MPVLIKPAANRYNLQIRLIFVGGNKRSHASISLLGVYFSEVPKREITRGNEY